MNEDIKQPDAQEGETPAPAGPALPEKPLDKMTATELRDIAMEIPGVQGASAMKKEELLELLKEYFGIEEEKPAKKPKVKAPAATVTELKSKIAQLRARKREMEPGDRQRIDVLRRRINRLKKMTRKASRA